MGYGPFAGEAAFAAWMEQRSAATDPYAYAVIDRARGEVTGTVTLMEVRPAMRVIEMGNIVYSPLLQRTPGGDRGAVSRRALRLRDARLPALRVEVQRPQCTVAAGGAPPGLYVRGDFPAAYDRQGPESGYRMVLHARHGMAEKEGLLRTVARPFELRRGRTAAREPLGFRRLGLIALVALLVTGRGASRRTRPTGSNRTRTSSSPTRTCCGPSMAATSCSSTTTARATSMHATRSSSRR